MFARHICAIVPRQESIASHVYSWSPQEQLQPQPRPYYHNRDLDFYSRWSTHPQVTENVRGVRNQETDMKQPYSEHMSSMHV